MDQHRSDQGAVHRWTKLGREKEAVTHYLRERPSGSTKSIPRCDQNQQGVGLGAKRVFEEGLAIPLIGI